MQTAPFTTEALRQARDLSRAVATLLDIAASGRASERDLLALLALAGDHHEWVRDQVEIVLASIEAEAEVEVDQVQTQDRGEFRTVEAAPIGGPFSGPRLVP